MANYRVSGLESDPKRPWKALVAGVVAFLGTLWAQLQGVEDWNTLGLRDWLTIVVPTVLAFAGTYLVRNPLRSTTLDEGEAP